MDAVRYASLNMRKIASTADIGTEYQELHTEWEEALGHPLTPTEFDELQDNLRAFFDLLHSWDTTARQSDSNELGDRSSESEACKTPHPSYLKNPSEIKPDSKPMEDADVQNSPCQKCKSKEEPE